MAKVHLTPYLQLDRQPGKLAIRLLGNNAIDLATRRRSPAVRPQMKWNMDPRTMAIEKNRLWIRYWRPTNWAFMNGDRVSQPSSRDDVDRRIRWLPAEVQQFSAMIAREEQKIENVEKGLSPP